MYWWISAVVLLAIGFTLMSTASDSVHAKASGLGLLAGGAAVALACYSQAQQSADRRRARAWLMFALVPIVGTAGNLAQLAFDLSRGPKVLLSVASACLYLSLLLGVATIITFPSTRRRTAEIARIVLDGVVIGGSLLFFASVTVFPQIVRTDGDLASRVGPLLVPALDIVVATTALLFHLRRTRSDGGFLGHVAVGFTLFGISDISSAVATVDAPFAFGSVTDLGWIAGYQVVALGVRGAFVSGKTDGEERGEASPVLGTALMFMVLLVAAVLNLREGQGSGLSATSAVLWLVVLLAVVGRQFSLMLDNESLRRGLEQRVSDRTRDLRSATQRSDLMLNSVGDGIYGVDRSGLVTFINPVGARTLGFDADAVIGKNAHDAFHAVQSDGQVYPEAGCYITEALTRGAVTKARSDRYVRADGATVPVEVTASPTSDGGQPVGAVVVFRDITQRLEVDRAKEEFVSVVSHELRTPLTSIRGSLAMLSAGALGELTPAAHRMATVALESTMRLGRLISDILDVERIHSGVMPMDVQEHAAKDLIDAAVRQVCVLAEQAQVTVEIGRVEGAVLADGDRIQQTLINLLDNAIKFSNARSSINVDTRSVGSFLQFQIVDRGRGIPPDKLDQVFNRFQQVDSSDARDHGGTGLGLAISRSIIERLGGRIWAESTPGLGTSMLFTLPRLDPEVLPDQGTLEMTTAPVP